MKKNYFAIALFVSMTAFPAFSSDQEENGWSLNIEKESMCNMINSFSPPFEKEELVPITEKILSCNDLASATREFLGGFKPLMAEFHSLLCTQNDFEDSLANLRETSQKDDDGIAEEYEEILDLFYDAKEADVMISYLCSGDERRETAAFINSVIKQHFADGSDEDEETATLCGNLPLAPVGRFLLYTVSRLMKGDDEDMHELGLALLRNDDISPSLVARTYLESVHGLYEMLQESATSGTIEAQKAVSGLSSI